MTFEEAQDIAREIILKMPASHHITHNKITFEYWGTTYNNMLDCLQRHIAAEIWNAYTIGYNQAIQDRDNAYWGTVSD